MIPRLLVLTDRSQLRLSRGLLRTLAECRDAGLTHVVLRELDEPPAQRAALCRELADLGLAVVAAHRPLPRAVGVHLPAGGDRRLATPPDGHDRPDRTVGHLVGRSCHTTAEVATAAAEGFDYVTLGPYAATDSKPGYGPPLPPEAYAGHPIPVLALGGVTPDSARAAMDAGAHGVAVMGAVMRAPDPAGVVAALLEAVEP